MKYSCLLIYFLVWKKKRFLESHAKVIMNPNFHNSHFHIGTCIGIKNMNSFNSQLASPCSIAFWHDTIWPPHGHGWPHIIYPWTKKCSPSYLECFARNSIYMNRLGNPTAYLLLQSSPSRKVWPHSASVRWKRKVPGDVVDQGRAWRVLR